jgi:hypothetical protein
VKHDGFHLHSLASITALCWHFLGPSFIATTEKLDVQWNDLISREVAFKKNDDSSYHGCVRIIDDRSRWFLGFDQHSLTGTLHLFHLPFFLIRYVHFSSCL